MPKRLKAQFFVSAIPFDKILQNKNVAVVITDHGGHTAFLKHFNPDAPGFIEELFTQYAQMVLIICEHRHMNYDVCLL